MVVKLRFARHGIRNDPVFHLVAIMGRRRRNARPLEQLGLYVPSPVHQVHRPSLVDLVRTVSSTEEADRQRLRNGLAEGGERVSRKEVRWDVDRIRYWLGVGAQPSNSVMKLLRTGGVVNDWSDLDVLRSRTTAPGTIPRPPALKVAAIRRSPKQALRVYRKRGLLPVETQVLPDGSVELPGSITHDGQPLLLDPTAVESALALAKSKLSTRPTALLVRRHPPPPEPERAGMLARKHKPDPARWRARRRARAVAYSLVEAGRKRSPPPTTTTTTAEPSSGGV